MPDTLFLLSPARCGSVRAAQLLEATTGSEIGRQLQSPDGAPLGDVFAFLSSLYFRGKLLYARAFARRPDALPGVFVITPGEGLRVESERITADNMRTYASVEVHHANESFTSPLLRDIQALAAAADPQARFVLLGSIASAKYLEPLSGVLGDRLLFPADFVGRGDMSRGGLLLRSTRENRELTYVPVAGATLRGPRPPRLPPPPRRRAPAG
ncbi:MAG TPA: hypothetical protein VJV78_32305 [Polyangiales bacterium]|nr:hypothetical protein [Polyangiales bacterium]